MKSSPKVMAVTAVLVAAAAVTQPALGGEQTEDQQIIPAGTQRSTAGSSDFFTGRVQVEPVWPADSRHRKCRRAERHMDGEGQRCAVPREISMSFEISR